MSILRILYNAFDLYLNYSREITTLSIYIYTLYYKLFEFYYILRFKYICNFYKIFELLCLFNYSCIFLVILLTLIWSFC